MLQVMFPFFLSTGFIRLCELQVVGFLGLSWAQPSKAFFLVLRCFFGVERHHVLRKWYRTAETIFLRITDIFIRR